jgi:hypothetical protein
MNRTPLQPSHPFNRGVAQASLFGALEPCDANDAPAPFAEPIRGLQVREIDASDVFRHFFGATTLSH